MSQLFNSITDEKLAPLLQKGAIGVLPTDTVYGLVSIVDRQPLARLYPGGNPDKSHKDLDLSNYRK